ncbi:PD-(D/E)XK nuclease family protein [Marinilongibacter aquaticus]|uniref:PD-(D/E)XK nuclease family protein n=1 Tax=Marinilongibacter aquaticus TaxID=2975157 RepID=UPI0021BD3390|nr:PD-(D/E)XK nuclease family protein [Marinilongibacter aquaticus]UBM59173.1 PD-(D/E)XK nuclease family protein [Marinilongibacter aquaticus]
MQAFLDKIAQTIFSQHARESLREQCVILPSRRATFFFKRALANCSDTPFIAPYVFSIDDFVCELAGLQIADNVNLLFELFEIYSEIDPKLQFNEFIRWGGTVLKDFDLIDQYLVSDPHALFRFMGEAEALSRWQPDSEKPLEKTENTTQYFLFYAQLAQAYDRFQQKLSEKNLAYRGMAYRRLAEGFEELVFGDYPFDHFYFVGLNALSKSEENIIKTLVKAKRGSCFWDTDDWFMRSDHQAGSILRRYQRSGAFGEWNPSEHVLQTDEKSILVLESGFESLQAKIGGALLDKQQTVFVVPDENLIPPLLSTLGGEDLDFNITMGLGLKQSKIWQLVSSVFALHQEGLDRVTNKLRFHYRTLNKLLNDPIVRIYEQSVYPLEQPFQRLAKDILEYNLVYLESREILDKVQQDPLFKLILEDWQAQSTRAVQSFQKLIRILESTVLVDLDSMEREFFMLLVSVCNRLEDEVALHKKLSIGDLLSLFQELGKSERVPFTGEPIADLQIMSLLETRCLDFEHVVLFSFNEGVIPSSQKNSSLIPYDACKAFGIPVFSDQDAIMSYHFFRLMMRAKKVEIIYVNSGSAGLGGGKEASRFVLQLEHELVPQNPRIDFKKNVANWPKPEISEANSDIEISKNEQIIQSAIRFLTKGISASALNTYYLCSLRFYYSKILGLSDFEEVEEVFGNDVFGNWIHFSIEEIAETILIPAGVLHEGTKAKVLNAIPKVLDRQFAQNFKGYQVDRGINLIYRQMAEKLLVDFYSQCVFQEGEKRVLASEFYLETPVVFQEKTYKLKGTIDSIELHDNLLMLIDFKTGKVEAPKLNLGRKQEFSEAFVQSGKDKFRQLLVYKYLIHRQSKELLEVLPEGQIPGQVSSGMYSFRDIKTGLIEQNNNVSPEDEMTLFEESLQQFISELLDPKIPFTQTEELKNCDFCSFKTICNR